MRTNSKKESYNVSYPRLSNWDTVIAPWSHTHTHYARVGYCDSSVVTHTMEEWDTVIAPWSHTLWKSGMV